MTTDDCRWRRVITMSKQPCYSSSVGLSPNSTCYVTSRHDKHDVSCVARRACSNMADDEEPVELAYKTISCFIIIIIYYFSSQTELIRWLKNYGDHNFIVRITNKLSCVSRLSRSSTRACRACHASLDGHVSRLLRSSRRGVSRLLYSMRNTQHVRLFLYQNAWAR